MITWLREVSSLRQESDKYQHSKVFQLKTNFLFVIRKVQYVETLG